MAPRPKGNSGKKPRKAASRRPSRVTGSAPASRPRKSRRVMITGIASYWGTRLALALEQDPHYEVIVGVDSKVPTAGQFSRTEFVGLDVKSPLLLDVMVAQRIDTVVHLNILHLKDKEEILDHNVLGTRHVLAACAEVGVQKVILRSSTGVYGAHADNPNFLPETWPIRGKPYRPFFRSFVEIERYAAEFRGRHPEMIVSLLRFASILGPTADTALSRYFRGSVIPTILGFDPLYQVTHEDDVVAALRCAVEQEINGPINIAADGVLYLSRIVRMASKRSLPIVTGLNYSFLNTLSNLPLVDLPQIELDYLRYLWVADTTRMKSVMGFQPRYNCEETVLDFAEGRRAQRYARQDDSGELGEYATAALREILEDPEEDSSSAS